MREYYVKLFFIVFHCLSFFSCCNNYTHRKELGKIDSLIRINPDTALVLLDTISYPEKMSKANYAYYCLLLTEAQDKTYYRFTSDSTIRLALDYYEATADKLKLPKAYYYMGRVCHTLRNAPQAINYYLKAKDALAEETDYALEARIYNQLGELYVLLDFNENAISAYQKAYNSLFMDGDSANLPYMVRNIARIYDAFEKQDSAIVYYNEAISSAGKVNNSMCEITSRAELISVFLRKNRLLDAKFHAKKLINQYRNIKNISQVDLILGKFFSVTGQSDSARYYLDLSMNTENMYTNAASIKALALLNEKERNYKQAVYYNHRYNNCRDSIEKKMNKKAVSDMEHFYNYQQVENENSRLKLEDSQKQLFNSRIYFSIILFLVLICALFLYYRQKKKKEVLLKEKELIYLEEKYRKSQEKIGENLQEIQVLKDKYEKNSDHLGQISHELIKVKKELLEQENNQIKMYLLRSDLQRKSLVESLVYREMRKLATDKILPQSTWFRFKEEIDSIYDIFESKLRYLYPSMSDIEVKVCYLIKAEFNVSEIAILLGRAKPSISSCRKRLYEKITGMQGSAEALDQIIFGLS